MSRFWGPELPAHTLLSSFSCIRSVSKALLCTSATLNRALVVMCTGARHTFGLDAASLTDFGLCTLHSLERSQGAFAACLLLSHHALAPAQPADLELLMPAACLELHQLTDMTLRNCNLAHPHATCD